MGGPVPDLAGNAYPYYLCYFTVTHGKTPKKHCCASLASIIDLRPAASHITNLYLFSIYQNAFLKYSLERVMSFPRS